jgi:bifunctional N-acetylglucosamine-1-phosphate-uridyltransferase/glucosamine-1-phosphate-acetyltransferase GlmU-like protein
VIRGFDRGLTSIVEHSEATGKQLAIIELNAGV